MSKISIAVIVSVGFAACSPQDGTTDATDSTATTGTTDTTDTTDERGPPEVTFPQTEARTTLLVSGAFPAPNVDWSGAPGTFSLAAPVPGVSVDEATGVVRWERPLPLGTSAVNVVAANPEGQVSVALSIDNRMNGRFTGGYSTDPAVEEQENAFEVTFCDDGRLSVLDEGVSPGTGDWTRDGATLTGSYTYGGALVYSVELELTQAPGTASLEGSWFDSVEPMPETERGYVGLEVDEACLDGSGELTLCDCPPPVPDLVLEPAFDAGVTEGLPRTLFCGPPPASGGAADTVEAIVRNTGTGDAPATTLAVAWDHGTTTTESVSAIARGGSAEVSIEIPSECYGGNLCSFTLTVDPDGAITESNEGDNEASSFCSLPAG